MSPFYRMNFQGGGCGPGGQVGPGTAGPDERKSSKRMTTMKIRGRRLMLMMTFWVVGLLALGRAQAAPLNDAQALRGLTSVKGVFMIDLDNPRHLAHVLAVVEMTDTGMARQGVQPHLVVVIIGPGVAFLTRDRRGIPYKEERPVAEVQAQVKNLHDMGIPVKACGVALKGMDVDPGDLIPQVQPVANGFVEAIGYQARGYQLVPVY